MRGRTVGQADLHVGRWRFPRCQGEHWRDHCVGSERSVGNKKCEEEARWGEVVEEQLGHDRGGVVEEERRGYE